MGRGVVLSPEIALAIGRTIGRIAAGRPRRFETADRPQCSFDDLDRLTRAELLHLGLTEYEVCRIHADLCVIRPGQRRE